MLEYVSKMLAEGRERREPSGIRIRLATYSLLEEPDGLRRFRYNVSGGARAARALRYSSSA